VRGRRSLGRGAGAAGPRPPRPPRAAAGGGGAAGRYPALLEAWDDLAQKLRPENLGDSEADPLTLGALSLDGNDLPITLPIALSEAYPEVRPTPQRSGGSFLRPFLSPFLHLFLCFCATFRFLVTGR